MVALLTNRKYYAKVWLGHGGGQCLVENFVKMGAIDWLFSPCYHAIRKNHLKMFTNNILWSVKLFFLLIMVI